MSPKHLQYLVFVITISIALPALVRAAGDTPHPIVNIDKELANLRGEWETKTFYDKWSFRFETDNRIVVDGEEMWYELAPETIRVTDEDATTAFPYVRTRDGLRVALPDGSNRLYHKMESGASEKNLHGVYSFNSESGTDDEWFEFDGDHEFIFHTHEPAPVTDTTKQNDVEAPATIAIRKKGVYRVQGSTVVLTFWNDAGAELSINWIDSDGIISRITYADRSFDIERPDPPPESEPTPVVVATEPIHWPMPDPNPPPEPYNPWPAPGIITAPSYCPPPTGPTGPPPTPPPTVSSPSPRPEHVDGPRNFGSTRPSEGRRP